jgi:cytoskeletal protein RodZ
MDSFGRFKDVRENKGLSVGEAAAALKIREGYLEAIESEDYSRLPEPVYAIGFIRCYATFLGVDGDEAVGQYRQEMGTVGMSSDSTKVMEAIGRHCSIERCAERTEGGGLSRFLRSGAVYAAIGFIILLILMMTL